MDWRKAIADRGGIEGAMLYGPPLAALVDEVERLEGIEKALVTGAHEYAVATLSAQSRASDAERLLAVERAEVVRLSNIVEPIQRRLVAVEAVVAAAKNEATKGVVTARLSAALAALGQEDR